MLKLKADTINQANDSYKEYFEKLQCRN